MHKLTHTNVNTDRKPVEVIIRQKLKAREQPNREPSLQGHKPEKEGMTSEEAIKEYSSKCRELVEEAWGTEEMEAGRFSTSLRRMQQNMRLTSRRAKERDKIAMPDFEEFQTVEIPQ